MAALRTPVEIGACATSTTTGTQGIEAVIVGGWVEVEVEVDTGSGHAGGVLVG